jgi:hypothetical protein
LEVSCKPFVLLILDILRIFYRLALINSKKEIGMEVQNLKISIGSHIQLTDIENNRPLKLSLLLY